MGSVNSGKTTFVNLYVKKLEKYGRTETLSLIQGDLAGLPVQFIDCPGHSALSYAKNVSLTLADAVIYVVDSNNVNMGLLEEIASYKPVIVLFNRWSGEKPLKSYFESDLQYTLYSQLVDKCTDLEIEVLPFFDSSPNSRYFSFPINFVSKWGVPEFELYFKKRWIDLINPPHKDYLYLVDDKNGYKYHSTKSGEFNLQLGDQYKIESTFFDHNPVDKSYTLRADYASYFAPIYVLDQVTPHPPLIELNAEFSVSKELADLLARASVLQLDAYLYADTPHKTKTLIQFFEKYKLQYTTFKNYTFAQFKNFDLGKSSSLGPKVKIAWVDIPADQININKRTYYTDSYYKLEDYLKQYLETELAEYVKKHVSLIKKEFVLDLLPQYVFKRERNEFVIGARLNLGVLTPNSQFKLKDGRTGVVQHIQYEKKKKTTWSDTEKNVAVELQIDPNWTPEDGPYRIFSLTLPETIARYADTQELELKSLYLTYKNKLNS